MENKQYLIFSLHNLQYGIENALVQEIFPLPELIIIDEASNDIIGLLNLRGQVVPVMHLDLLQGHVVEGCNFSDSVIVVQWEGLQIGMVVHQVNEILELNDKVIELEPYSGLIIAITNTFIYRVFNADTGKILLINFKTLISRIDAVLPLIWNVQIQLDEIAELPIIDITQQLEQDDSKQSKKLEKPKILSGFYDLYCPSATPEAKAIFRQRADNLRQSIKSLEVTKKLIPLAVIGLGNEYFGLDLELVREFTNIRNLSPIPYCPNHIVGNMNLRGEIVTLVDIRNVLNLPTTPVSVGSQVVVVQVDDIVAGLPVEQVLDMVYLNSTDMILLPITSSTLGEEYFRGTAFFEEKMLKLLDLPKVFTQGGLVVDEEV